MDHVRALLDDIGPVKPTTLEEEIACARVLQSEPPEEDAARRIWQKAYDQAQERLIFGNLGFIRRMIRHWVNPAQEQYADYLQMALVGATIAAQRYHPQELDGNQGKRTGRFVSYARHWIMQVVLNDVIDGRGIKMPASMRSHLKAYRQYVASYFEEHGREPSAAQVQKHVQIDASTYQHLMGFLADPVSLQQTLDFYDELQLEQAIVGDDPIAEETEAMARAQYLDRLLFSLPSARMRRIVQLLAGSLPDPETGEPCEELNLEHVGVEFGLVRQQVATIAERAYVHMRAEAVAQRRGEEA